MGRLFMNGLRKQLTAGFLLLFLFAGCGTTQDHRIRVYSRDFQALDNESRERIRAGRIDYGFTPRMVYMALGEPLGERVMLTDEGERTVWIYAGLIGEDDSESAPFRTTSDLIWGSPLRRQAYDRLQVVFKNNEVIRIHLLPRRRLER